MTQGTNQNQEGGLMQASLKTLAIELARRELENPTTEHAEMGPGEWEIWIALEDLDVNAFQYGPGGWKVQVYPVMEDGCTDSAHPLFEEVPVTERYPGTGPFVVERTTEEVA